LRLFLNEASLAVLLEIVASRDWIRRARSCVESMVTSRMRPFRTGCSVDFSFCKTAAMRSAAQVSLTGVVAFLMRSVSTLRVAARSNSSSGLWMANSMNSCRSF